MRRPHLRPVARRLAVPLVAAATLTASVAASAADLASPIVSGLRWRSGVSVPDVADPARPAAMAPAASVAGAYAAWRGGRRPDVNVVFVPGDSWTVMENRPKGSYFRSKVGLSAQLVVSLPMMPATAPKRHAACARGEFDGHFRTIGAALQAAGAGRAVLRLGWEYNRGSGSHAWGIDTAEEIPAYVACFRREVAALKSAAPGLTIEWTNGRYTRMAVSPTRAYPGDDVVDIVGIHYYDNPQYPRQSTQAEWDRQSTMTYAGGPMGIATWVAWASDRGKKLAVSEWGVWGVEGFTGSVDTKGDDPVYVQNMYDFFDAHADAIAYENYYGRPALHRLFPTTVFPRSSALYRRLWSGGQ
jgi:hypothetical protein